MSISRAPTPLSSYRAFLVKPSVPLSTAEISTESATLSRELGELLIELSIGLHKHAIYPSGHPQLGVAQDRIHLRLSALLAINPSLAIGVARNQLVIQGIATDATNALLRELAQRLHRHQLGAVKFSAGLDRDELAEALNVLAEDGSRAETPLGMRSGDDLRGWPHVRLYPLSFQHLELLDESDSEDSAEARPQSLQPAQLWMGLARAALASQAARGETGDELDTDPLAIARAIDAHSREVAYDQVIVGYLLQIADELKHNQSVEATALKRRVSRLVGALDGGTLRELLRMGGDAAQQRRFVLDACEVMAVDTVVDLVRAAAETTNQTISHSLLRMLQKLAMHAGHKEERIREPAETALRENVRTLVRGWTLEDPNPTAYRDILEGMANETPEFRSDAMPNECEPARVLEMSVETGTTGPASRRALLDLVRGGRADEAFTVLEQAPAGNLAAEVLFGELVSEDSLRMALSAPRVDFGIVERILARGGVTLADVLIETLASSEQRAVRSRLLDLLAQLGSAVAPRVIERLPTAPWYVQRNLLLLLGRLPELPGGFSVSPYAAHEDGRVRREALKVQLRQPAERERAILTGLTDSDPDIVHMMLGAAAEEAPLPAAPLLIERLHEPSLDEPLRALAVRALAPLRLPNVVTELLRLVVRPTWFRRVRLVQRSPVMLAALSGLAAHWAHDPRVAPVIRRALASGDPEMIAAARTPARERRTTTGMHRVIA